MLKIIELEIPIRTFSESNLSDHWTEKNKRKKQQRFLINSYMNYIKKSIKTPCIIKLTRIAPRKLDSDNLVSSFKFVRDAISDLIKPGMAPGRSDAEGIDFMYDQSHRTKQYAIKVEIYYDTVSV